MKRFLLIAALLLGGCNGCKNGTTDANACNSQTVGQETQLWGHYDVVKCTALSDGKGGVSDYLWVRQYPGIPRE